MSTHALNLTCCCGAALVYAGTSYVAMGSERDAFNRRHAECKPPAPVRNDRYRLQIAGRR